MRIKHGILFSVLWLVVLMSAALCAAEDGSLGFSQDLFIPVFLNFDGVSDDAGMQYIPAESAEETAVLKLSDTAQVELLMTEGVSGPEVREIKLISRLSVDPLAEEIEAFNHSMSACLRTAAALTGWEAGDDVLQAFLTEIAETGSAENEKLRGVYALEEQDAGYLASFRLLNGNAGSALSSDSEGYQAFETMLASFQQAGKIPAEQTYEILNAADFTDTWAMMDTPHWESFANAKNFVITAEVSWSSAYETPNTAGGGCGFVFREAGEGEYMMVSLRMDGNQYLTGRHNWLDLSYPSAFYDLPEISGAHQLTVVVNEEWVEVYLDGAFLNSYYGAAILTEGWLGFATLAGTNYDFGTRCTFKNIFYTAW